MSVLALSAGWACGLWVADAMGWSHGPPPGEDQSWADAYGQSFGFACCTIALTHGWYRKHRRDLKRFGYVPE